MPLDPPYVRRRPWEERSVVVALILAILVPGLGHLFQGRYLKGLIYLFGILGLFIWGVKMGEGVVVYNLSDRGNPRKMTLHYAAQLGAGAIAYPGFFQAKRALKEDNRPVRKLDQPLKAPFSGRLTSIDNELQGGDLEGTVEFQPASGDYSDEMKGQFTGTLDGKPTKLSLAGGFSLDKPIAAGFRRALKCGVASDKSDESSAGQVIVGSIPRPIVDGYGVPPDMDQLQEISGRLGKQHELALVFTWIAGLLNILAIWDCVQGPAYGFGDEGLGVPLEQDPVPVPPAKPDAPSPAATPV